jgi:copper chaperone CopZ
MTMFRRRFLQLCVPVGAGALAMFKIKRSGPVKTVVYEVKGFTCITCAVGLDTMLRRQKGILSSESTYPGGEVVIHFDPDQIAEKSIRGFIADTGFTVQSQHEV